MKKIILSGVFLLIAALIFHLTPLFAYTIDGLLGDWGVNLSDPSAASLGYLNTHLPSSGYYAVDDDDWVGNTGWEFVDPGYSNRNTADAEAIYFDYDSNNAYIAVVTGTPKSWSAYSPYGAHPSHGDIFIDTGKYQYSGSPDYDPFMYEYGLNVVTGRLYRVNSTVNSNPIFQPEHHSADPWIIGAGTYIPTAVQFFSRGTPQQSHYVMEAKIPLTALGLGVNPEYHTWLHWTMDCGNDYVNFSPAPIPEPATLSLLGMGLLGLFGIGRKKFKKA